MAEPPAPQTPAEWLESKDVPGARNRALLLDNASGEVMEVFVMSETPVFRNEISDEPLDLGGAALDPLSQINQLLRDSLSNHIKFLPLQINVQGLLVHGPFDSIGGGSAKIPGVGDQTYGSFWRPTDTHYEVGRQFAQRVTTFAWVSPNFPNAVFDDLMIEEFAPSASTRFPNAYEVTLVLKAILTIQGGVEVFGGRFGTREGAGIGGTQRGNQELNDV